MFDSFSDWEPAYAIAEITSSGKYDVETFGISASAVKSAGGLMVTPGTTIADDGLTGAAMIIIPGGTALEERRVDEVLPVIEYAYRNNIPVAAICAGTTLLADMGMLDDIPHTGNDVRYLQKMASWYKGAAYYKNEPAVTSGNIITATGVYPVEFAREIFIKLQLHDNATIEKWYQLFKHGIWQE